MINCPSKSINEFCLVHLSFMKKCLLKLILRNQLFKQVLFCILSFENDNCVFLDSKTASHLYCHTRRLA